MAHLKEQWGIGANGSVPEKIIFNMIARHRHAAPEVAGQFEVPAQIIERVTRFVPAGQ